MIRSTLLGRSTPIVAAGLTLLAGGVLVLLESPDNSTWLGSIHDTARFLTVFAFAIAGALATITGFLTAAETVRDRDTTLARSPRSLLTVLGTRAAGDLAWLALALLLVTAVAYLRTSLLITPRDLTSTWPTLLLAASELVATYLVGLAAGTILRARAFLVVLAPLPYLALFIGDEISLSGSPGLKALVNPSISQIWGPGLVAAEGPLLQLSLYVLAIGAATIAIAGLVATALLRGRWSRPLLTMLAGSLASALVLGSAVAAGWSPSGFARENPAGRVCDQDNTACVWADQEDLLPEFAQATSRLAAVADAAGVQPRRGVVLGLEESEGDITVYTPPARRSPQDLIDGVVSAYGIDIVDACIDPATGFSSLDFQTGVQDQLDALATGQINPETAAAALSELQREHCG